MNYKELLNSHKKFGTLETDILIKDDFDKIQQNVVIAPWWDVTIFDTQDAKITKINNILYNVKINDITFSYIQLKRVGASGIMDSILRLGVTKCKNLLFIGSAGSLSENINIGDLVIPTYSVCGDGATRYLNKNLEDEFGKKEYPNLKITKQLLEITKTICKENKVNYHNVPNFSVDTVFAQFYHMDYIINTGVQTIEMETANVFKCSKIAKINTTALFCISDNIIKKKSLYSGRTEKEKEYRYMVRYNILPKIIMELLKKIQN